MRILFVDDEPGVLDGLRRMLRGQRAEWDMHFANGGEEALELMRSISFDVIVTDMRMPRIDGASLLAMVRDQSPDTVRIVLSGQTDQEAAVRAIPYAHQFLTKPCESETIKSVIGIAASLRRMLRSESMLRVVGEMEALPALPAIYQELRRVLADPDSGQDDIVHVVERDLGITTKILQIVNSAFIGLPQRTSNLRSAIGYLGTNMIRSLVLTSEVFRIFDPGGSCQSAEYEKLFRDGLAVGRLAKRLVSSRGAGDAAFMAGMLHDVGMLIQIARLPAQRLLVQQKMAAEGCLVETAEIEIMGVCHAELGGYLLGLWGLPTDIVAPVVFHHHPEKSGCREVDVVAAVAIADALLETGRPNVETPDPRLESEFLASIGAENRLPEWQALAEEVGGESVDAA